MSVQNIEMDDGLSTQCIKGKNGKGKHEDKEEIERSNKIRI